MQITSLFVRRGSVVEMILLCYAAGIASLVCLHMPLVSYAATLILPVAVAGIMYGLWWLARPASGRDIVLFSLALAGILISTGAMVMFAETMGDYSLLQLRNSVTEADTAMYRSSLMTLLGVHTAASALGAYALYALLNLTGARLARAAFMQWFAMPLQFLLMKLYGLFLPLTA